MPELLVALVLALTFLGLCFAGRAFWGWVVAGALALAAWWSGGVSSPVLFGTVCGLFGLCAVVFGLEPLRRALITSWLMRPIGMILPKMSATEKEALDAGTVWWDGELFSGAPNWKSLLDYKGRGLSDRERAFLNGPLDELCHMLDDYKVTRDGDLPPEVWQFIKDQGLMGMIIPEEHGGLGFSAEMQSIVIARLTARCGTAAVTVMVPNSLGPAELILHYGTDEQRERLLPRLASGDEVPAFALTEPPAGSDAASMRSSGIVCKGQFEGREVVGIRLNWDKRYITLAPVATLLGLAFKLYDPDHLLGEQESLGITCALIPTDTPGVTVGERHDPLGVPFMNGPTYGEDVFVPIDHIIGGADNAGKGWGMLMQCLSAGRGISLPSLSSGAAQLATRLTGAYATVREQFNMPIGKFEGIEARLARIAGLTYLIDGGREITLKAIDNGEKPSVITAIMKAYATESMRTVINDAMDIQGGAGICRGPRNVLAHPYQSVPIGITVEGANILTRSMIIFGQGAIRCHPFVQPELSTHAAGDVKGFDRAFFGHVNFVFTNIARSLALSVTGGGLASAPVGGPTAPYFKQLTRASASFALVSDFAMATLGAALKRKENLTGRLADALAWQYLGSGTLKKFIDDGQQERDLPALHWAMAHALHQIQVALDEFLINMPNRPAAWMLRRLVFPFGARLRPPTDRVSSRLARAILEDQPLRHSMTPNLFIPDADEPGLGQLEDALKRVMLAREATGKLKTAQRARKLPRSHPNLLEEAVMAGVITEDECELVRDAERARDEVIQVDSFPTLGERAAGEKQSRSTAPAF